MSASLLVLILAFLLWALVHSLLAALPLKAWARRRWGPAADRWYRLGYNVVAGITFLPVLLLLAQTPNHLLYAVPAPWAWLMRAGQGVGVLLFLTALGQTDLADFVGLRQAAAGRESAPTLRLDGLQAWMRHPLYTTALIVLWLNPTLTLLSLLTCLLTTAYFYLGSIHEEARLLAEFGPAYAAYRQRTFRLLPWPPRQPPEGR